MRADLKRYAPFVFVALALSVLMPLMLPGYILTLDMVFTPRLRMPDTISSSYLFHAGLSVLNVFIPSQIIQKLMLLGILFLSAWGMFLLTSSIQNQSERITTRLGAYIAGAFYMINPFTYSRFMAGQYSVLLGYMLLPFFAKAWLLFLTTPSRRQMLRVAAWIILISIVSVHTLGAIIILVIIGMGSFAWRWRGDKQKISTFVKLGGLALLLVAISSSYWLVPLAFGHGRTAQSIQNFSDVDRQAFATEGGSSIGQLANIFRLQGFWAEGQGLYRLPQDNIPAWGLMVLVLWVVIGVGIRDWWRHKQRFVVILFGASAIVAALLATSIINNWLASWLPLFAGFREPHKFVSLVALAGALFLGQGITRLAEIYHKKYGRSGLFGVALIGWLLVAVITSPMFWGFNGQLRPRNYPADWSVVNQRLRQDNDPHQTLFLPWHLYTEFSFSGRIIANPAASFFDVPVLVNDDPEYAGVQPALPDLTKQTVRDILAKAAQQDDLAIQLSKLNIKYIMLSKDSDADTYTYLEHQAGLRLIQDTPTLKLYVNEGIMDHDATR